MVFYLKSVQELADQGLVKDGYVISKLRNWGDNRDDIPYNCGIRIDDWPKERRKVIVLRHPNYKNLYQVVELGNRWVALDNLTKSTFKSVTLHWGQHEYKD